MSSHSTSSIATRRSMPPKASPAFASHATASSAELAAHALVTPAEQLRNAWADLTATERLGTCGTGAVAGLVASLRAYSFASLVFPEPVLPQGLACFALSTFVAQVLTVFRSALGVNVVAVSSGSLPFFIAYTASVAAAFEARGVPVYAATTGEDGSVVPVDPMAWAPTMFVGIGLSSLLGGVFLHAVGQARGAVIFRYIQAPVISGLVAGLGCILLLNALELATLTVEELASPSLGERVATMVSSPLKVSVLLLTLVFGVGASTLTRTRVGKVAGAVPGAMLLVFVVFHIGVAIDGRSEEEMRADNWLFERAHNVEFWKYLQFLQPQLVDWGVLGSQWPTLVVANAMVMLDLAMTLPTIAQKTRTRLSMNDEFRTAGLTVGLTGLLGGGSTYISLGCAMANADASAVLEDGRLRISSLVASFFPLLMFFIGGDILLYTPKFYMGGIIIFIGWAFIVFGVWAQREEMSKSEYANIAACVVVAIAYSMLEAFVVGISFSCVLYAVRSAQKHSDDTIKFCVPLAQLTATSGRSDAVTAALRGDPSCGIVLGLSGYLFFGSVPALEDIAEKILHLGGSVGDAEAGAGPGPGVGGGGHSYGGGGGRSGRPLSVRDLDELSLPAGSAGVGGSGDHRGPTESKAGAVAGAGAAEAATNPLVGAVARSGSSNGGGGSSGSAGASGGVDRAVPLVLLLDFSRVSGLDGSTSIFFRGLKQDCDKSGVRIAVSGANEGAAIRLRRCGILSAAAARGDAATSLSGPAGPGSSPEFKTLDAAILWAETYLTAGPSPRISRGRGAAGAAGLAGAARVVSPRGRRPSSRAIRRGSAALAGGGASAGGGGGGGGGGDGVTSLSDAEVGAALRRAMPSLSAHPASVAFLCGVAETVVLAPGARLYRAGDVPNALYVVVRGRVEVTQSVTAFGGFTADLPHESRVTISQTGAGALVGTAGFLSPPGTTHADSAEVVGAEEAVLLRVREAQVAEGLAASEASAAAVVPVVRALMGDLATAVAAARRELALA